MSRCNTTCTRACDECLIYMYIVKCRDPYKYQLYAYYSVTGASVAMSDNGFLQQENAPVVMGMIIMHMELTMHMTHGWR